MDTAVIKTNPLKAAILDQFDLSVMLEQSAVGRRPERGWDAAGLSVWSVQAAGGRMKNHSANHPPERR